MNCRGVLDVLSDYLEGDAGSTICKKIEEHLKGCERCRMHIDAMKKMIVLYKKWRDEPIPEDVRMRLQDVFVRECVLGGIGPARASRPGRSSTGMGRRTSARKQTKPAAKASGRRTSARKQTKPAAKASGGRTSARKQTKPAAKASGRRTSARKRTKPAKRPSRKP